MSIREGFLKDSVNSEVCEFCTKEKEDLRLYTLAGVPMKLCSDCVRALGLLSDIPRLKPS